MNPSFFTSILLGLTWLLSGCATIMNQGHTGYPVSSVPPGAQVSVNGHSFGGTPMVLAADRGRSHMIRIEKDGCPTFDTIVSSKVSPWVFGNIVLGGLIGLFIDMSTGAMYELDPAHVSIMYGEQNGSCVITGSSSMVVRQISEPPAQNLARTNDPLPYTSSMSH